MQRMISVTVILEVDPVRVEEFLPIVKTQAAASRREPGCLRFEVSQQLDKPNVFALSEMYERKVMEEQATPAVAAPNNEVVPAK